MTLSEMMKNEVFKSSKLDKNHKDEWTWLNQTQTKLAVEPIYGLLNLKDDPNACATRLEVL